MTFEQLRYFCAAADCGAFSRAAGQEHISQPSLCASIRKLEGELGVELFIPGRRGAILTGAGREFLGYARSILSQADQAAARMRGLAQRSLSQIHLAYTAPLAEAYVPRLLKDFLDGPGKGCCIYSTEAPSDQILRGLREGRMDLGLCSLIPPEDGIVQVPVLFQGLCLIRPPKKAAAPASPAELSGLPFISYQEHYPMYRQITRLFQDWGVCPSIVHYAYSERAIARFVEQGMGVSIVARTDELDSMAVEVLTPPWLSGGRYIYLTSLKAGIAGKAARLLAEYILEKREAALKG